MNGRGELDWTTRLEASLPIHRHSDDAIACVGNRLKIGEYCESIEFGGPNDHTSHIEVSETTLGDFTAYKQLFICAALIDEYDPDALPEEGWPPPTANVCAAIKSYGGGSDDEDISTLSEMDFLELLAQLPLPWLRTK